MHDLISVFPVSAWDLVSFSSAVFFTFFGSVTNIYSFYSSISARLAGSNSLINLPSLRILKSLELSFTHEFYCRLPGFTDMYNNGKTEPGKNFLASYVLKFELDRRLWDCPNGINYIRTY